MIRIDLKGARLIALFLLGLLFFNYPIIALFNRPTTLFGFPLLYLWLFAGWGLIIILVGLVTKLSSVFEVKSREPKR